MISNKDTEQQPAADNINSKKQMIKRSPSSAHTLNSATDKSPMKQPSWRFEDGGDWPSDNDELKANGVCEHHKNNPSQIRTQN